MMDETHLNEMVAQEAEPTARVVRDSNLFKVPQHVIFVDAYPMIPRGKIRKVELRAEARRQPGERRSLT